MTQISNINSQFFSYSVARLVSLKIDKTLCTEAVRWGYFIKKVFIKILQNSQEKQHCRSLFFNKFANNEFQKVFKILAETFGGIF